MKPLLDNFPARRLASFFGIILVVGFQLVYLLSPRMGFDSYREHERRELLRAWGSNPTPATKSALLDEIHLENHHHSRIAWVAAGSFLVIDGIILYAYWRCWIRKSAT